MKTLNAILQGLSYRATGSTAIPVSDIMIDSRQVKPGSLFVALKGVHRDGHSHVADAIRAGASAVVVEKPVSASGATVVEVPDTLKALAPLSLRFWDHPSSRLRLVGITGTNGKTTTSYLIESIFSAAGWPTGLLGTISYRFKDAVQPAPNTTPYASELQRFLATLVDRAASACVMEVSSHALDMGRVDGIEFDVAVFTNLTQDHLDYHQTMESYGAAKMKLFTSLDPAGSKKFPKCAVLNAEDPCSEKMAASIRVPVLRYRLNGPADLHTKSLQCDASGSRFELHVGRQHLPVRLALVGDYNVMNSLAAAGAAYSQGIPLDVIVKGLEQVRGVPGRMETLRSPHGFTVVVDYAHTEDALRQVMTALRRLKPHRLLTVFGCGGDRDRTKRPLMGAAAAEMSDEVIVTSDNPRSEDPGRIALDVEVGVRRVRTDHYEIILDRKDAIAKAFSLAQSGDIVLIAGKGHENYQILSTQTVPFDDRLVAKVLLEATQ